MPYRTLKFVAKSREIVFANWQLYPVMSQNRYGIERVVPSLYLTSFGVGNTWAREHCRIIPRYFLAESTWSNVTQ